MSTVRSDAIWRMGPRLQGRESRSLTAQGPSSAESQSKGIANPRDATHFDNAVKNCLTSNRQNSTATAYTAHRIAKSSELEPRVEGGAPSLTTSKTKGLRSHGLGNRSPRSLSATSRSSTTPDQASRSRASISQRAHGIAMPREQDPSFPSFGKLRNRN